MRLNRRTEGKNGFDPTRFVPTQAVRGVIVAREIGEDLLLACSLMPAIQLFEYELSLKLKRVANENRG